MSDNPKKDEPSEFAAVLIQHKNGLAHDEATERLREVVEAVKATGQPGNVTVTLAVKPVPKIPGAYRIIDSVTAKIPREERTSMWFGDENGGLHRNQPGLYGPVSAETTPGIDGKSAAAGRD